MEAQVTPNTFCTYTGHPSETDTTVFFVSGNPGLISYYHPFLSLLAQNLADHHKDPAPVSGKPASCQIYGNSLGGFEIEKGDQLSPSSAPHSHGDEKQKPEFYDLEDQIHFVHRNLHDLMAANAAPDSKSVSPRRKKVILIGHSVGAYITMEILRRHREATSSTSTKDTSKDQLSDVSTEFDVVGGVLLFPTVMDIASSPSGRKLTVCIPFSPLAVPAKLTSDIDTAFSYTTACACSGIFCPPSDLFSTRSCVARLNSHRDEPSAGSCLGHDV